MNHKQLTLSELKTGESILRHLATASAWKKELKRFKSAQPTWEFTVTEGIKNVMIKRIK